MPLLGNAAVAMWWDIETAMRSEFADWHSHEHFPERMSIPGFHRGSRWASTTGAKGFFVLYELAAYETLTSPGYVSRLNDPTPWSTKMMPHHRNMVRSQARIVASYGSGIAGFVATVRLSPRQGGSESLAASLKAVLSTYASEPGLTGGHLLVTETPATAGPTTEQRIRGRDGAADWIAIVCGYDRDRVQQAVQAEIGPAALERAGAQNGSAADVYALSYSLTTAELKPGQPSQ